MQGDGGLVSGAGTLSGGAKSQKLLSTPGIEVDVAINGNGFPSVTINDSTGVLIPVVLDQGGTDGSITLQPGTSSLTPKPCGSGQRSPRPLVDRPPRAVSLLNGPRRRRRGRLTDQRLAHTAPDSCAVLLVGEFQGVCASGENTCFAPRATRH